MHVTDGTEREKSVATSTGTMNHVYKPYNEALG